jgi:hypothetical protein
VKKRGAKKLILGTPTIPGPEDVEYGLIVDPETDISFRREFAHDPEVVEWIEDQLEEGNEWAWCMVDVVARWTNPLTDQEYEGHDYLGGCSYESEESFKQPGGYYPDMKERAYEELIKQIEQDLNV